MFLDCKLLGSEPSAPSAVPAAAAAPVVVGHIDMGVEDNAAADEVDEAQRTPAGPVDDRAAARPVRGRRDHAADNRDLFAPNGCTLRKYIPASGSPYWVGVLPPDRRDSAGHRSKRAAWGFYSQRSEAEALDLVERWLHEHGR